MISVFDELALMQARVPKEPGGPGFDLTTTCRAKELVAMVSMTDAQLINQNPISFVLPLLALRRREVAQQMVADRCQCRVVSSVAMIEPHAGSDAGEMKTKAVRDGDHYIVNGQKCFTTMAPLADWAWAQAIFAMLRPHSVPRSPIETGFPLTSNGRSVAD